jgi:hypothetical protein
MANDQKSLLERLRDIEEWVRDCGWHNRASTAREAIAELARDDAAYARGVEDAAKALEKFYGDDIGFSAQIVRALIPNPPATEEAPKHDDEDLAAAHCIKYHQARELD